MLRRYKNGFIDVIREHGFFTFLLQKSRENR